MKSVAAVKDSTTGARRLTLPRVIRAASAWLRHFDRQAVQAAITITKELRAMKRTIEIEDTLAERVATAEEELEDLLETYLDDNPDDTELPCLHNDLDYSGGFHELVDSNVPIYTAEIEGLWYLYHVDFEEAYENAGCGEDCRENDGMAAIYYYINEKCCNWYLENAQGIFDKWLEDKEA